MEFNIHSMPNLKYNYTSSTVTDEEAHPLHRSDKKISDVLRHFVDFISHIFRITETQLLFC